MIIQEQDFRLIPVAEDSPFFDLELLYTIRPKGKEARQEFKISAYGITLEGAIKRIAHYRVSCNHKDKAVSLTTYFSDFKKELDSVKNLCKVQ